MIRHPYARLAVHTTVGGALALSACGTGSAGRDLAGTAPHRASVSAGDRTWLIETHRSGLATIQYGRLAQRKGTTSAVREAGSMLAADHAALDQKVVQAADRVGVDLPASAGTARLAVLRRLENEAGSRFDRDFTTTLAEEHREAIAEAQKEANQGRSPEVTGLARAALPDLRRHLAMLRKANPVG